MRKGKRRNRMEGKGGRNGGGREVRRGMVGRLEREKGKKGDKRGRPGLDEK